MNLMYLFSREKVPQDDLKNKARTLKARYDEMLICLNNHPPKDFKRGYKDLLVIGSQLSAIQAQLK